MLEFSKLKVGRLLSWKGASLALFTWLLVILFVAHHRDAATLHLKLMCWYWIQSVGHSESVMAVLSPLQQLARSTSASDQAPKSRPVIALNQWKLGKDVNSWDGEVQKLYLGHDGSTTFDFASSANNCKDAWSPFSACEQGMHRATSTTPVCHKEVYDKQGSYKLLLLSPTTIHKGFVPTSACSPCIMSTYRVLASKCRWRTRGSIGNHPCMLTLHLHAKTWF